MEDNQKTRNNDCYFYYYSSCTKGTACPYRHEPAALRNETVCLYWLNGTCNKANCIFRHMEITKQRDKIQCWFETQPGGCKKPHCPFQHINILDHPREEDALKKPDLILPVKNVEHTGSPQPAPQSHTAVVPTEVPTGVEKQQNKTPAAIIVPLMDGESDQESYESPVKESREDLRHTQSWEIERLKEIQDQEAGLIGYSFEEETEGDDQNGKADEYILEEYIVEEEEELVQQPDQQQVRVGSEDQRDANHHRLSADQDLRLLLSRPPAKKSAPIGQSPEELANQTRHLKIHSGAKSVEKASRRSKVRKAVNPAEDLPGANPESEWLADVILGTDPKPPRNRLVSKLSAMNQGESVLRNRMLSRLEAANHESDHKATKNRKVPKRSVESGPRVAKNRKVSLLVPTSDESAPKLLRNRLGSRLGAANRDDAEWMEVTNHCEADPNGPGNRVESRLRSANGPESNVTRKRIKSLASRAIADTLGLSSIAELKRDIHTDDSPASPKRPRLIHASASPGKSRITTQTQDLALKNRIGHLADFTPGLHSVSQNSDSLPKSRLAQAVKARILADHDSDPRKKGPIHLPDQTTGMRDRIGLRPDRAMPTDDQVTILPASRIRDRIGARPDNSAPTVKDRIGRKDSLDFKIKSLAEIKAAKNSIEDTNILSVSFGSSAATFSGSRTKGGSASSAAERVPPSAAPVLLSRSGGVSSATPKTASRASPSVTSRTISIPSTTSRPLTTPSSSATSRTITIQSTTSRPLTTSSSSATSRTITIPSTTSRAAGSSSATSCNTAASSTTSRTVANSDVSPKLLRPASSVCQNSGPSSSSASRLATTTTTSSVTSDSAPTSSMRQNSGPTSSISQKFGPTSSVTQKSGPSSSTASRLATTTSSVTLKPAPTSSVTPKPAPTSSVTLKPAPTSSVTPKPAPTSSVTPKPVPTSSISQKSGPTSIIRQNSGPSSSTASKPTTTTSSAGQKPAPNPGAADRNNSATLPSAAELDEEMLLVGDMLELDEEIDEDALLTTEFDL